MREKDERDGKGKEREWEGEERGGVRRLGVAIKSGLGGGEIGAKAPKNFFCTSPPISAFWGGPNDLSLYRPKDV